MRDEQHYDVYRDVDEAPARRGGVWRAALAAAVSLAVTGAVVVWAYRLGVRDAYEVPVVRALDGPSKIRPEEPGGAQFAHQGRSVYDAVAGAAAQAPASVTLAPAPESLADEDAPMTPPARPAPAATGPAAAAPVEPVVVAPLDATAEEVDLLVAAVLGDSPEPEAADPFAPDALPAVPRSAAPAPRPSQRVAALDTRNDAAPAPAPAGPQVQLGAYLSEADALRMWTTIRARNGDLLAGRQPVVAPLVGTNRTLYRLRAAPFADLAEARALCAAMRARREECLIPGPD
jgi:hypothetical protein